MRILYNNQFDSYTVSANSEDGDYPAANVQNIHLTKVWRSTGLSAEWIKIDAGSGNTVTADTAIVAGHNLTSGATIKIQASADDFSTTPLDETITYNAENMVKFFTEGTYRYWRFNFTDASNTDGYISIGRVSLGSYYQVSGGFSNSFEEDHIDTSTSSESITGQTYGDEGIRIRNYDLTFPYMENSDKNTFDTFVDTVKKVIPFFLIFKEDDLTIIPTLYCKTTSNVSYSNYNNARWSARLRFKEVF